MVLTRAAEGTAMPEMLLLLLLGDLLLDLLLVLFGLLLGDLLLES